MTDERFPSDPPDRPGWWRCKCVDGNWRPTEVLGNDDALYLCYKWLMIPINVAVRDGWRFAGRVEMPGEDQ